MNTTIDTIMTRTSVRKFKDTPVGEENLAIILRAAMAAPSAINRQPWAFVVINDRSILNAIGKSLPYAKAMYSAPLAIAVCGNLKMKLPIYKDFWVQDCSAATQNMLLAAKAMGLGSLWMGVYPIEHLQKSISEILQLPKHIVPLNIVAFGYAENDGLPKEKFDSSKIKFNTWDEI